MTGRWYLLLSEGEEGAHSTWTAWLQRAGLHLDYTLTHRVWFLGGPVWSQELDSITIGIIYDSMTARDSCGCWTSKLWCSGFQNGRHIMLLNRWQVCNSVPLSVDPRKRLLLHCSFVLPSTHELKSAQCTG